MVKFKFVASLYVLIMLIVVGPAYGTGEPSTYFNIFVPPNNDAVNRNACLIVTAIYDSTYVEIIDDGMDGDTDDSWSGYLNSGQSYVLYIKDNGINDDAQYASGGAWKQDGDYFIISSNNIVYASQSTNSDWQHDWVPSTNKSSIGQRFIIYAPPTSYSNRDLNVFAYSDSTSVVVKQVSSVALINMTTFTEVDMTSNNIIAQFSLNIGEDIIHKYAHGRNVMESGHTYLVESNKPITVQYGALYQNARDGGGYVPASNGSSAGELFYFAVPYQASNEQEIRVVSWDDGNDVELFRYSSGTWVSMKSWTLDDLEPGAWTGNDDGGTYPTVFKVVCETGKKVSIFEANWMESGSPGTSDMATMLSSSSGTTSGIEFLAYMAPPGNENRVLDPFSGIKFGGQFTHLYVFAKDSTDITISDAYSNGADFTRSYSISPGRYIDCALNLTEWRSIYNGDGNPTSGPERPYLKISSTTPVSVMNTNFNDNWMMYFGSSLAQSFEQTGQAEQETGAPGEEVTVTNVVRFNGTAVIENATLQVFVSSGAKPVVCQFKDQTTADSIAGNFDVNDEKTVVSFPGLGDLDSSHSYIIETVVEMQVNHNDGSLVDDGDVIAIESVLTGIISGETQQSSLSIGIENQSSITSNLIFTEDSSTILTSFKFDNWTANWVDFDGDNDDDLYVSSYDVGKKSKLFENQGGTWVEIDNSITFDPGGAVSAVFADIDNDGDRDVFIALNGGFPSLLYKNNGDGNYTQIYNDEVTDSIGYHHGATLVDYDNDGFLDLYICDFFPTKYNQLHHNKGDGSFTRVFNQPLVDDLGRSIGATWCDYDNDGDQDLFVPTADLTANKFYVNEGGGVFTARPDLAICLDDNNSVASAWGDYDNDGFMDLFVSTASNGDNLLYHNNGDGTFTKITSGPPVSDGGYSHGCSWADIDNDGDLDLYVTNDQLMAKFLYLNDGLGNFTKSTNEVITSARFNTYGHYWSDFDQDGDLDLYLTTHEEEKNALFTNNGGSNHWIELKLIGSNSNKSAIGTRVKVVCGGTTQAREVNSQSGFGGQHSLIQHFGLGSNTTIDSIIINWPSGYIQNITSVAVDQLLPVLEDNSAKISGVAYEDENGNCVYDVGEKLIPGREINVVPGNLKTTTNANGEYQIHLANGNYNAKSVGGGWWAKECTWNYPLTISNSTDHQSFNFAYSSIADGIDLEPSGAHTALRKGFRNQFLLSLNNKGTRTAKTNLQIDLEFPSEVVLIESSPVYDQKSGDTYTWFVDSIQVGATATIAIVDSVSIFASIGDSATFNVTSSAGETELNIEDNNMSLKEEIVGSIDPNDLQAWPKGSGPLGLIDVDQWITYKIRFQNVGNYPASFITVTDVLHYPLDLSSFQMLSASHHYRLNQEGTSFVWQFNNINLVDSTTNESESHGYIVFKVKIIAGARVGTKILNEASIIFDYEQAVPTNSVRHTILSRPSKVTELTLIPNPATSTVLILVDGLEAPFQLIITNSNGQNMPIHKEQTESGFMVDVSDFNSGVYMVRLLSKDGTSSTRKLMVITSH
ncbi:MAG: VCBS repeat-containing protein [Flavobacteriales bacterium]|nr:VCBS repeat-containing protein [Flavobacteriales bacterium]